MLLLSPLLLSCAAEPGDETQNSAPEVTFVRPAGTRYVVGETIPFLAQVYDAERAPSHLLVSWAGADGTVYAIDDTPDEEGLLEGALTFAAAGDHTITLSATDPAGNVGTASVSFAVAPNQAPECAILAPELGYVVSSGDGTYLVGQAADAEVRPSSLRAVWTSSLDGVLGESVPSVQGSVRTWSGWPSAGEHELSLTVTDPVGATCTDTVAMRVNSPPEVSIDTAVVDGTDIRLSGRVSDDHDDPGQLSCVLLDEATTTVLDRPTPDPAGGVSSTVSLVPGIHVVWLGAEDADGAWGWSYVELSVSPPP